MSEQTDTKKRLHALKEELHKRQLEANRANRNLEQIKEKIAKVENEKYEETKIRLNKLRENLKALTPREWVSRLSKVIDDDTRIRAMNIVWWDFFSNVTVEKRTIEFDSAIKSFRTLESRCDILENRLEAERAKLTALEHQYRNEKDRQTKAVYNALVNAGYGKELAHARMYSTESEQQEKESAQ